MSVSVERKTGERVREMAGRLSLYHRTSLCYLLFSTFIIMDVYVSLTTVMLLTQSNTWIRSNISDGEQNRSDGETMSRQGITNQSLPVKDMASHNENPSFQKTKSSGITWDKDIPTEERKKPNNDEFDVSFLEAQQEGWEEPPLTYFNKVEEPLTYFKKVHKLMDPTILMLDMLAELSGFTVFLILNVTALVGLRKRKALLLLPWIIVYLISISASYINFSFLLITHLVSDSVNNWKIFLPLATGLTFHLGWILVKSVFEDFKKQMPRSEQSDRSQVGYDTTSNL